MLMAGVTLLLAPPLSRRAAAATGVDDGAASGAEAAAEQPPSYTPGFRIQVIATPSPLKSVRARLRAERVTGCPAEIEWEEGLYKVRVGAFASHPAAVRALSGFADSLAGAWVTGTVVRRDEITATEQALAAIEDGE